jgi:hypothetical protein
MNQAVFAAALTGSVDHAAGRSGVLDRLCLATPPDQVLTDHAACYPPANPAAVLEPLYPDRLAEDFLALTLSGHAADYPAQPWATAAVAALLARATGGGTPAVRLSRAITFLATAAERWPHVGTHHLFPVLHRDPQLALDAGSAALTALAGTGDIGTLAAIEPLLPVTRHVDLDSGAASVSDALTSHQLGTATDPAERARLHSAHAGRLHHAGRREEALAHSQQALALLRALAADGTPAHQADLALTRHNHAVLLGELDRREEALWSAREAPSCSGGWPRVIPRPIYPAWVEP